MKGQWFNKIPYVTRSQRVGILALSILIVALQLAYFVFLNKERAKLVEDVFDRVWMNEQLTLDSLRSAQVQPIKLYPFNPNFITDYKGYTLGMTIEEIDRLHAFRSKNKYVNSAAEFQEITGVSDRWLDSISVYFKFPTWKANAKKISQAGLLDIEPIEIVRQDINSATQDDLMEVRGIGPVFSERIIREREKLGGFVTMKQLEFIWGINEESVENLKKYFAVLEEVRTTKININTATLVEISEIPYLNYPIARGIVVYRSNNGDFKNLEELENIKNFPLDKLEIISLYLAF